MAKIIEIRGKNKTKRLNNTVKELRRQGKKVFSSDENLFFEITTALVRKRIHQEFDVIVNVPRAHDIYNHDRNSLTEEDVTKPYIL